MNKWIEIRNGDTILFKGKTGTGSVVFTEFHGNYFMPAKIGMRIKGPKKPIKKFEEFVLNDSIVQSANGNSRIVKCMLTRLSDNVEFAISEFDLMQYFGKTNQSRLGGPNID
jgi:hypothetical protein